MSPSIKTQSKLASIKQFNCKGCGAAHEVKNPRARELACQYCGSVLDVQSEEHQILRKLGNPGKHDPFSFIRLGQNATFDGRSYQVLARTRWRQKYKEYWSEEGETGYSNEIWIYDEWLLIDENRTYFYLVEDKEGYWRSEEIIPETPVLLPEDLRMSLFKNQGRQIVREYGMAEVIHFEGESNYHIRSGDQIRFAMFRDRGLNYSSEWRYGEDEEIKEVEFFCERPLSRRRLLEAFSDNPEVEALRQRMAKWGYVAKIALFTLLAMIAMVVISAIWDGSQVYQERFTFSGTNDEGIISQPIKLPKGGLYQLQLEATELATNSEGYVFAYVLDGEQQAIGKIEQNFYNWTGYEDGEQWTEKDRDKSEVFRLDQGGTYYLQLFFNSEYTTPTEIRATVFDGVLLTRYFVFGVILALIGYLYAGYRQRNG